MKRLSRLAWMLLLAGSSALGQVVTATQNNSPALDYPTTALTTFAVTRFEIQFDAGAFISIGLPTPTDDAKTLVGDHTYAGPKMGTLGLSVGNHTMSSHACNVAGCGQPSLVPLAFTYAPIPDGTANPRVQ